MHIQQSRAHNTFAKDTPDQGLDYVVCGMPRGGTTFLGEILNGHEDIYCYFMETAVFRQLWMFGSDRPFPKENILVLESWLRSQFYTQLIESTNPDRTSKFWRLTKYLELLDAHGLKEETGPGLSVFDPEYLKMFVDEFLELFHRGLYGSPLFVAGNRLIGKYIREKTKRSVIGEKTPDNIFALDIMLSSIPHMHALCMVREPFTTMESMRRRAVQAHSVFDTAFSTNFFDALGEYYGNIQRIIRLITCAPLGRFHLIRYEDLIDRPDIILTSIYASLGAKHSATGIDIARNCVIPTPCEHPRDVFSPTEIALTRLVLGRATAYVGYTDAFFQSRGFDCNIDMLKDLDQELIVPLEGIYRESKNTVVSDNWMKKEASIFVLFSSKRKTISVRLSSDFPNNIGTSTVNLQVYCGHLLVAEKAVSTGLQCTTIDIRTDTVIPYRVNCRLLATTMHFVSSFSYRPITFPKLGIEMKELSFCFNKIKLI